MTRQEKFEILLKLISEVDDKIIDLLLSVLAFLTNKNGYKESMTIHKIDTQNYFDIEITEKTRI